MKQNNSTRNKYKRYIQLQDDYKNYYLAKPLMRELSEKYNLSVGRVRIILERIHFDFIRFLNTDEHKHLRDLMRNSISRTRRHLKGQPKKLEELLRAFDIFAANRKDEADES